MFKSLGAVLSGAPTGQARPLVRKGSRAAGREGVFWRSISRQEVQRIVLAARRYELALRPRGARKGPLGHIAIEVLELFANLIDFGTGRLDPSLEYLMSRLHRSRDAIVRALKALRDHGFLNWLRRYVSSGNTGRGPQVRQTSNAYRLSIPAPARQLLGRLGTTPPPPDDFEQARATRSAMIELHRSTLAMDERAIFDVGDTSIGRALARLAKALHQRESAERIESNTRYIKEGQRS